VSSSTYMIAVTTDSCMSLQTKSLSHTNTNTQTHTHTSNCQVDHIILL